MPKAGSPKVPEGAIRNDPDGIWDGYMLAEPVAGSVRIDMYEFALDVEGERNARFCKLMDLDSAKRFTIMLISAIERAEIEDSKKRRKRK